MKLIAAVLVITSLAAQVPPQSPSNSSTGVISRSNLMIPLTSEVSLPSESHQQLFVQPGVTAVRTSEGYTLSTFDGSRISVFAAGVRHAYASPVVVRETNDGWNFGPSTYGTSAIRVGRETQDDTDSNLKSMQENAKKLKAKNPPTNNPNQPNNGNNNQGNNPTHWRLLFSENPMPTAELFNAQAIQQLSHLSPIGF